MLEIRQISKAFPGVQALSEVSIEFRPGEIHALVGENGAGKSTLIKIMCGIYAPDEGEVRLDGERLTLHTYRDAIDHKINMVSQEIQVIPKSTIAENIVLDKLEKFRRRGGAIDWKRINREAQQYIEMVDLHLPAKTVVSGLSAAQKQLIMIARALSADAKVLVLDEPTSSLTLHETANLLQLLQKLKLNGVTIIFVTHKLEEVLQVADKVSVLRDGQLIGTREIQGLQKSDIVTMMIGRETITKSLGTLEITRQPVLEAQHISRYGQFDDVNFSLYKGEILGFYGLVGAGRTELAQILIGEAKKDSGEVFINGQPARIHSMADSLFKYRMGYVSENRKEKGLILGASIKSNITVTVWNRLLNRARVISLKQESAVARKYMDAVEIKATGPDQPVNRLSGGNQQKVSISKWLAAECDILIIDEPTVGVDIGAKEYIHQLIWDLAKNEGKSIIIISSDMPEIVNVARRILVFKEFKIVGEVDYLGEQTPSYEQISQQIGHYLA
jgi:ribose transport system ATP-binding protein